MPMLDATSPAHLRHALRTPLNHIIGYAEMMREELNEAATPHSDVVSALDAIVFNARELVRFVQNAIPPGNTELRDADVRHLQAWLQPHLVDLLGHVAALEAAVDPARAVDVARIRAAAERMLAFSCGDQDVLEEPAPLHQTSVPSPAPSNTSARILVVDDSPVNRDLLRRILERGGYQIVMAETGDAALEILAGASFDLILLDVIMPGKSGYDVLERIKSSGDTNAPVIMMSALDEGSSVIRCVQMGAEDYFIKPFDPILLRTRIESALDSRRLRALLARALTCLERFASAAKNGSNENDELAALVNALRDAIRKR